MTVFACEYCLKHQVLRAAGEPCPQCAVEASPLPPFNAWVMRAAQPRDTLGILEGRIADLEAENLDLRRRVSALEHQVRGSR